MAKSTMCGGGGPVTQATTCAHQSQLANHLLRQGQGINGNVCTAAGRQEAIRCVHLQSHQTLYNFRSMLTPPDVSAYRLLTHVYQCKQPHTLLSAHMQPTPYTLQHSRHRSHLHLHRGCHLSCGLANAHIEAVVPPMPTSRLSSTQCSSRSCMSHTLAFETPPPLPPAAASQHPSAALPADPPVTTTLVCCGYGVSAAAVPLSGGLRTWLS